MMKKPIAITTLRIALAAMLTLSFTACDSNENPNNRSDNQKLHFSAQLDPAGEATKADDKLRILSGGAITLVANDQKYVYEATDEAGLVPAEGAEAILVPMMQTTLSAQAFGTMRYAAEGGPALMPVRAKAEVYSVVWSGDVPAAAIDFVPAATLISVSVTGVMGETDLPGFTLESELLAAPAREGSIFGFDEVGELIGGDDFRCASASAALAVPAVVPAGAKLFTLRAPESTGAYAGNVYTVYNTSLEAIHFEAGMHYRVGLTLTGNMTVAMTVSEPLMTWDILREKKFVNGVEYDFVIKTVDDLKDFRTAVNAGETSLRAIQLDNIDLTGVSWEPIGSSTEFSGIYNGNGFKIKNMTIEDKYSCTGLFGRITQPAVLTGIHLEGVDVAGSGTATAALVGETSGTETGKAIISLCTVTGKVSGTNNTGALVGMASNTHITRSFSTASVSAKVNNGAAGGLIGMLSSAVVVACYASGGVTIIDGSSNASVGGLVGKEENTDSRISLSYATGAISGTPGGTYNLGGLVGHLVSGTVRYNYALVWVAASHEVANNRFTGAVIGKVDDEDKVNDLSGVPGEMNTGNRLAGNSELTGKHWARDASGRPNAIGIPSKNSNFSFGNILTTSWNSEGFGVVPVEKSFSSHKTWTETNPPSIVFKLVGEE